MEKPCVTSFEILTDKMIEFDVSYYIQKMLICINTTCTAPQLLLAFVEIRLLVVAEQVAK